MKYISYECSHEDGNYLAMQIRDYNKSMVQPLRTEDKIYITRKVLDINDEIIAGIVGSIYLWDCMYIDIFWIKDTCRRKGLGTQLLHEIEMEAKQKGIRLIHLETFDFQAKDFYLKNGYEVYATLADYPKEHQLYYLKKMI